MNRREAIAAAVGSLAGSGVTIHAKEINAGPAPLCLVVKCQSVSSIDAIKEHFTSAIPNCPPVVVIMDGMEVTPIYRDGAMSREEVVKLIDEAAKRGAESVFSQPILSGKILTC